MSFIHRELSSCLYVELLLPPYPHCHSTAGTQVSTKKVMIQWLQALLPAWGIKNFTSDWRDGRALIALINEAKPGIVPDLRTLDPTKHLNNCSIAIRTACNHLKIPQLISPESLARGHVDELSMMTYLSYYCDIIASKLLKWIKRVSVGSAVAELPMPRCC